jgi:8-oxo-dGTP pyrophosphatase MutT (NUDIX family)
MRWTVHGERSIYESDWIRLTLVDVEIPGQHRFEHHVVRMPHKAAGAVVHDPDRGLLLLWRHRFITDTWGWEIPAGGIEPGETPEEAATRETIEETGWAPGPLKHLVTYQPTNGLSDQRFHIYLAAGAQHVATPTDPGEAERIEWVPIADVRSTVEHGEMPDGLSLTAVLYALTFAGIG